MKFSRIVPPFGLFFQVAFMTTFTSMGFTHANSQEDNSENSVESDDVDNLINRGPYFDTVVSKNVTALVGKSTTLKCRIRNLGNKTVSWIRHRDLQLLAAGAYTFTPDQRFSAAHNPATDDWTLRVRYVQHRDAGIYECQVGTSPPKGIAIYLNVIEPVTTMVGGPEIYINRGSTLNLTCLVRHSPEPPPIIYWTHDNQEINYDSARGGVSVITEKGDVTISMLLVQKASEPDSGKYTCHPANADTASVHVHVLKGEHPEAMQHGGQLRLAYPFSAVVLSILVALV